MSVGSGSGPPTTIILTTSPQQPEQAPPLGPWPPRHRVNIITANDHDDNASALSMASALSSLYHDDEDEEAHGSVAGSSSSLVDPGAELMKMLPPSRGSGPASRTDSRGGGGRGSRIGSARDFGSRPGSQGIDGGDSSIEQQQPPRGTLYGGGGGGPVEEGARPISPFGSNAARPAGEHLGPVYQRHVVQSGRFPVFRASAAYQATMDGDDRGWADCALHEAAVRMRARSAVSTPTKNGGGRPRSSRSSSSGGAEPASGGGSSRREMQGGSRGGDGNGGGGGGGEGSPNARSATSPDTLRSVDTLGNYMNVSLADYSPGMSIPGVDDSASSDGERSIHGRLSPRNVFGGLDQSAANQGPAAPPEGLPPGLVLHHSSFNHRSSAYDDDDNSGPFGGLLKCATMPVTVGATEAELKHLSGIERRRALQLSRAGVPPSQPSLWSSGHHSTANRAATTGLGLSAGGGSSGTFAADSRFATSVPKPRRLHRPVPITEAFKRDLIAAMARETKLQRSAQGEAGSRAPSRRLSARSNAQSQKDHRKAGHEEGNSPLMSVSASLDGSSLLRP